MLREVAPSNYLTTSAPLHCGHGPHGSLAPRRGVVTPSGLAQPALQAFLDQSGGEVLVLHDELAAGSVLGLAAPGLTVHPLDRDLPELPARWAAVLVAVADAGALRRLVSVLSPLGRTRRIACLLVEATQPLTLLPRAEWPELAAINARRLASGDLLTVLKWTRPLAANVVLEELARSSSPARSGNAGLFVATTSQDPDHATAVDPGVLVLSSAGGRERPVPHRAAGRDPDLGAGVRPARAPRDRAERDGGH